MSSALPEVRILLQISKPPRRPCVTTPFLTIWNGLAVALPAQMERHFLSPLLSAKFRTPRLSSDVPQNVVSQVSLSPMNTVFYSTYVRKHSHSYLTLQHK